MARHNKKIRAFIDAQRGDPAFSRWWTRLKSQAHSTQEGNLYKFAAFLERFGYTPQSLLDARMAEVTSDDPLKWGVIKDQAILFMREMVDGDTDEWPDSAFQYFRLNSDGDLAAPLAPGTASILRRALSSFFETFGERVELTIKAKDMPQGDSEGTVLIQTSECAKAIRYPGSADPYKNAAVFLFLKDSGLRRSDVGLLTVGDYREARRHAEHNDYGEPFISFDAARTTKERILAHIHLGPEAISAIDEYLEIERPSAAPDEPLFIHSHKGDGISRLDGHSAGEAVKRMIKRGLGDHGAKRKSAHSLRKLHKTGLEAGGLPENAVKYIQGKARDTYSLHEKLRGPGGEMTLMEGYMRAYNMIRVHPHDEKTLAETRGRIQDLEGTVDALRQEIEALRPAGERAEILEAVARLNPDVRRLVERLAERIREAA